jgi:selenocysteine-specific translation elongation factor
VAAIAGDSVALQLEDELDVSRGDMIADAQRVPRPASSLQATLCWLSAEPLSLQGRYLLRHTTRTVKARIQAIDYRVDVQTLERVRSSDDDVICDDGAEFEGKCVERADKLRPRNDQRRRKLVVVPRGETLRARAQIVRRQCFRNRQRVDQCRLVMTVPVTMGLIRLICPHAVVHERLEAAAEDLAEIVFERPERGKSVSHLSIINECA